jgi:hypothetical protein
MKYLLDPSSGQVLTENRDRQRINDLSQSSGQAAIEISAEAAARIVRTKPIEIKQKKDEDDRDYQRRKRDELEEKIQRALDGQEDDVPEGGAKADAAGDEPDVKETPKAKPKSSGSSRSKSSSSKSRTSKSATSKAKSAGSKSGASSKK